MPAMDTLHDGSGLLDSTGPDDEDADAFVNPDITELHRMWRNEKYAPELLPFTSRVVENLSEVVEFVGEEIDEERADQDADPNDPSLVLRCADLERVRYVLRDYLRIRLWKLTQWPQHYLERENMGLLSDAERNFLREYWHSKKRFFENRLLGGLPPSKQSLDEKGDLMDMVRRPCLNKFVYARILADLGTVEVPPSATQDSASTGTDGRSNTVSTNLGKEYPEGRTYLVRYAMVRKFLLEAEHAGKVELV